MKKQYLNLLNCLLIHRQIAGDNELNYLIAKYYGIKQDTIYKTEFVNKLKNKLLNKNIIYLSGSTIGFSREFINYFGISETNIEKELRVFKLKYILNK